MTTITILRSLLGEKNQVFLRIQIKTLIRGETGKATFPLRIKKALEKGSRETGISFLIQIKSFTNLSKFQSQYTSQIYLCPLTSGATRKQNGHLLC